MFLEPIEKPRGLVARVAYWLTRRQFGKVITPLKVAYARVPEALHLGQAIKRFTTKGVKLDPALALLLQTHAARLNNCAFCIDIAQAIASGQGIALEKFGALDHFTTDPRFSDRERAGLAFVEAVTLRKRVEPETFARMREHYTEREIVEVAFLNAIEHFYNIANISLGIESDGLCPIGPARPKATRQEQAWTS